MLTRISLNDAEADRVPQTNRVWQWLGALHTQEAHLDEASTRLIQRKVTLENISLQITLQPDLAKTISNFESLIAADSAFNEYALHARIHDWFVQGTTTGDLETLNTRVYAELFRTPRSDPWLGLLPPNVYAALPNRGIVK